MAVYDISGKVVYAGKAGSLQLARGLYIVRCGNKVAKVIL
jgi:hypothetical protein